MMNILCDALAIVLGLICGAAMSVAVSCAWCVLMLPARLQDRLRGASSASLTWALWLGLSYSAAANALGLSLHLPPWCGAAAMLGGGMFVGMLASALGEILEVTPVLMRRFRLGSVSRGMRWMLLLGKGLGAALASLALMR